MHTADGVFVDRNAQWGVQNDAGVVTEHWLGDAVVTHHVGDRPLLMRTNPRADVDDDFQISKPLQSRQPADHVARRIDTHNPGMTDHHWTGGLVRIGNTDNDVADRLLLEKIAPTGGD
jgi:hypothetical protein